MYVTVSASELLSLFTFLQSHTTRIKDVGKNPTLIMLDNLMFFMSEMYISIWASLLAKVGLDKKRTDERTHIKIHEDHWIVKMIEIDKSHPSNANIKKLGIIGVQKL